MLRRDLITLAVLAPAARAAAQPRFFTPDEFAAVEELAEMIIPADEKSGGAKAAGVAAYIDGNLAEAFDPAERDAWRKGLASFLHATSEQRMALLTRMSETGDPFFQKLKSLTVFGYYTSKIGIHDEMGYLGNTYQQGEYAGELPGPSLRDRHP
jgi:hypothetical protein